MPSHAALAKAGKTAGKPARRAKRAKRVMPTIGEISTRRSGRDSFSSLMESSAYIKASAPPLEKPDQMQRRGRPGARACFAHRKPRRRHPVLPLHVGQRGRDSAMCRHPRHDSHKPLIAIEARDMALTVRGIRQSMQKHDRTDRLSLRLQHKGTIEILRKVPRIDRTALKIPIGRHTLGRVEFLGNLAPDVVEDPGLGCQIFRPVGRIEFFRRAVHAECRYARARAAIPSANRRCGRQGTSARTTPSSAPVIFRYLNTSLA